MPQTCQALSAQCEHRVWPCWHLHCSQKMQWCSLLALADLYVINSPYTHTYMHSCKPDSSCGPCSRGARVWLNSAVAESDCCPEAVAPSPIPRHCVVVHDLQLRTSARGVVIHAQTCRPPSAPAAMLRPFGANMRTVSVVDAGSGRTRRANSPPPHPPTTRSGWCQSTPARENKWRKCAAGQHDPVWYCSRAPCVPEQYRM